MRVFHGSAVEVTNPEIRTGKFTKDFGEDWDIAKVYKRLIISVSEDNPKQYIKTLITVYSSWIADKIDDYNSSFYYDTPGFEISAKKSFRTYKFPCR